MGGITDSFPPKKSLTKTLVTAGSMYDAANESVTLQLAELVSNSPISQSLAVSSSGARLALPAAGVALSIPEGALSRGRREQIYVAVVKDDRYRSRFGKGKIFVLINSLVKYLRYK